MAMWHFTFYPFDECYFFSEMTAGDEGFFFNDDLAPMCSERGVFKRFQKYITQKTWIPFADIFRSLQSGDKSPEKKTLVSKWQKFIQKEIVA
jgi:hypothetical protein